jgi:hypothetical protein
VFVVVWVAEVEDFEQRETVRDKENVCAIDATYVGTSERGQSCNLFGKSSQPICGNVAMVREIE